MTAGWIVRVTDRPSCCDNALQTFYVVGSGVAAEAVETIRRCVMDDANVEALMPLEQSALDYLPVKPSRGKSMVWKQSARSGRPRETCDIGPPCVSCSTLWPETH